MKAIELTGHCGIERLRTVEVEKPKPATNEIADDLLGNALDRDWQNKRKKISLKK